MRGNTITKDGYMKNLLVCPTGFDDYFDLTDMQFFAADVGLVGISNKGGTAVHPDVSLKDDLGDTEFAGNMFPGLCI
jgi:hypothetical protein